MQTQNNKGGVPAVPRLGVLSPILVLALALAPALPAWGRPSEISYEIEAVLDPQRHLVAGSERIEFRNSTQDDLHQIYLYLYPNRLNEFSVQAYTEGLQNFDQHFPHGPDWGYLHITSLRVNGQDADFTIDDVLLRLDLQEPLPPGNALTLELNFLLKIPRSIERLGYRGTNHYLSWWYPQLAVYDEGGWHTEKIVGVGAAEPYQDFARYRVSLTVPQDFVVGATGTLEEERRNPDGTRTLVFTAEDVHDFAWVADPRYRAETVECDGIQVVSLYWPEDARAGRRAAQYACDALRYFGERFGPYPYGQFTVAEVGMFGGAMEYPQLVMNTYFLYRVEELPLPLTLLDVVTAHEIAHQWFYGVLANDQINETWLDEGFATYAMDAYAEHKYGKDSLFDLSGVPEWLHGPLKGVLGGLFGGQRSWRGLDREAYAAAAREGREAPLLTPRAEVPPGKQLLPYQKGAMLLFALEHLLGHETFDRAMQDYFDRYKFRHVRTEDFIAVVEEVSGQELDAFFHEWLYTTETIDYVLERVELEERPERKVYRVVLRNDGGMRSVPVDVELEFQEGTKLRKRWSTPDRDPDGYGVLLFPAEGKLKGAVIDPDGVLPDINRENNALRGPVPVRVQPWVGHGVLYGHPEDGPIVGARLRLPDLNVEGKLGYLPLRDRLTSELTFSQRLGFLGRHTSRLSLSLKDDTRIRSAEGVLQLNGVSALGSTAEGTHHLRARLFASERYGVLKDPGRVRGLSLRYELSWEDRRGLWGLVVWERRRSLPGSAYGFEKVAVEAQLHRRVAWQTNLGVRLFLGRKDGREPLDSDFDLREDGLFRTFERQADELLALNVDLRFPLPLPGLSFVELPWVPLPLSFGGIVFADGALLLREGEWRAEAGIGLTFGPYGQRDLVRFEYPLWLNTEEDGGKRELRVRVDVRF